MPPLTTTSTPPPPPLQFLQTALPGVVVYILMGWSSSCTKSCCMLNISGRNYYWWGIPGLVLSFLIKNFFLLRCVCGGSTWTLPAFPPPPPPPPPYTHKGIYHLSLIKGHFVELVARLVVLVGDYFFSFTLLLYRISLFIFLVWEKGGRGGAGEKCRSTCLNFLWM